MSSADAAKGGDKKEAEDHGGGHKKGGHRRKHGGHAGEHVNLERWLVSYADFMTLLFCVFTVLYAMSKTDESKVQEVAQAITEALSGSSATIFEGAGQLERGGFLEGSSGILSDRGSSIDLELSKTKMCNKDAVAKKALKKMQVLKEEVKESLDKTEGGEFADKIAIDAIPGLGVRISLPEQLTFKSGEAAIRRKILPALDSIGKIIKRLPNKIVIEGHTDNVPIKTEKFPSNWELSTTRATNVLRYLLQKHTLNPINYTAAGYGEFHPILPNSSDKNRERNRRVDIIIIEDGQEIND